MSPQSLRVLSVSPLDYDRAWNNRDHNLLRVFRARGCEVTHLYKAMNRSARPLDLLRDVVTMGVRTRDEGGLRLVRVDPFFNYYAGYRARSDAEAAERPRPTLRRALVVLLSPLAFVRDLFVVPCLLAVALAQPGGAYDACVGFGPWGALVGWWLRRLGRVRVLVYEDRDYEPGLLPDRFRRRYTEWVDRFVVPRSDLVFSVGERLAALRRRQGARAVHVAPNGVSAERFAAARASGRHEPTLLYTGNLLPWCGLEVALRALPALARRFPEVHLRVVGDGPSGERARLAALARDLGIEARVTWLGSRPHAEVPGLMEGSAIGLANSEPVPFRSFACPLKVLEYMAAGLPVLGTVDTETEALLARFECGLAVAYDPAALAAAAERLLGDPELHARLRANGIRHSAELTWERVIGEELDRIARRAAAGSGGGPRTTRTGAG